MLRALFQRIHMIERDFTRSFGKDISTPKARRSSWWHFQLTDHAFLRVLWTNQYEIAPGVWRSNQPSPKRLRKLHKMGIRTILNLRGEDVFSHYLFERETCDALGITLVDKKIYARYLVNRADFMDLFAIFDRLDRPFLLHCKSGADRAGLVSALWLLDKEGASIAEAKAMLSLKYAHLKKTKTGLMDQVLVEYEKDTKDTGMSIRDWFATHYDPKAVTAAFHREIGTPSV